MLQKNRKKVNDYFHVSVPFSIGTFLYGFLTDFSYIIFCRNASKTYILCPIVPGDDFEAQIKHRKVLRPKANGSRDREKQEKTVNKYRVKEIKTTLG